MYNFSSKMPSESHCCSANALVFLMLNVTSTALRLTLPTLPTKPSRFLPSRETVMKALDWAATGEIGMRGTGTSAQPAPKMCCVYLLSLDIPAGT